MRRSRHGIVPGPLMSQRWEDFAIPLTGHERAKGVAADYTPRPGPQMAWFMDEAETTIRGDQVRGVRRTTRNVAYRTAARIGADHTKLHAIGIAIVKLRRTKRVAMYSVRDGRTSWTTYWTPTAAEAADSLHRTLDVLKADRQDGQPHRVVLAAEATGMLPTLEEPAAEYGVEIMSGSGSVPLSATDTVASMAVNYFRKTGIRTVVLFIGDFDLKGIRDIFVPVPIHEDAAAAG